MARPENMGKNAPQKRYETYWGPDGEPRSVNLADPIVAADIIKNLLAKGCTKTKPKVTAADKRAAEAKAKAEADKKAEELKRAADAKSLAEALKK